MRRMPWAVYLWPGLPQLWARGSWSALLVAIAAAGALNLALLGSFVWSELLGQNVLSVLWLLVGTGWTVAAVAAVVWNRRLAGSQANGKAVAGFEEALQEYLKGNWFQCERVVVRLLRQNARDLDARLMLATLLRHTRRFDEATEQLDLLTRLEGAEKWQWEIHRERELLSEVRTQAESATQAADVSVPADDPDKTAQAA